MKHTALILAAAITLALAACTKPADKPADAAAPAATTETPAAADPAAAPAADTAAAPAATDAAAPVAAADSVGIPECDDYLTKVSACLTDKVPAEQRAMFQTGLDSSRTAWKQAAANPASKASLAQACSTALAQSKTQFSAFGCTL